jgi:hypothetical protein
VAVAGSFTIIANGQSAVIGIVDLAAQQFTNHWNRPKNRHQLQSKIYGYSTRPSCKDKEDNNK